MDNEYSVSAAMDWLALLPLLGLLLTVGLIAATIHFLRCCFVLKIYLQLFRRAGECEGVNSE